MKLLLHHHHQSLPTIIVIFFFLFGFSSDERRGRCMQLAFFDRMLQRRCLDGRRSLPTTTTPSLGLLVARCRWPGCPKGRPAVKPTNRDKIDELTIVCMLSVPLVTRPGSGAPPVRGVVLRRKRIVVVEIHGNCAGGSPERRLEPASREWRKRRKTLRLLRPPRVLLQVAQRVLFVLLSAPLRWWRSGPLSSPLRDLVLSNGGRQLVSRQPKGAPAVLGVPLCLGSLLRVVARSKNILLLLQTREETHPLQKARNAFERDAPKLG